MNPSSFSNTNESDSQDPLLPDFQKGPLSMYRQKASFNWRELALFLDGEDFIRCTKKIFTVMENDPVFARRSGEDLPVEKYVELTFLRCKRLFEYEFLTMDELMNQPLKIRLMINCLGMYDWSLGNKFLLNTQFFARAIQNTGSERHRKFLEQTRNMEIFGCFVLTELSHGSNAKAIRTTANYDASTKEFIINSPDFEAAKFWPGNMGKAATHAVVYAQLYTPDGQNHGLHLFIVQIRDPKTLFAMPGVMVGDVGKKLGLHGWDNGFAIFHKVRIPHENLLNRNGDISSLGVYTTPFKDPKERHAATLGMLTGGRVIVINMAVVNLKLAVTIAVRFSATRRQFGPTDDDEIPVLEYQMQQWRLIPYLAASYVLDHFSKSLLMNMFELQEEKSSKQVQLGQEMHALTSAGKPLVSWTAQQGAQECREACGGHGYLAMNRLGDIRNENDINCSYEGENNVILQQTSNYLLRWMSLKHKGQGPIESPLGSVNFLEDYNSILDLNFTATTIEDCMDPSVALAAYKWLVCYLLKESFLKLQQERLNGSNEFDARNNSQVYYCRSLSLAFIELTILQRFHDFVEDSSTPSSLQPLLRDLCTLYGLWSLNKHMSVLYQGGYCRGDQAGKIVNGSILELCAKLKNDAVALVDVIAPPDFILNSPIAKADGELYKNLWSAVLQGSKVLERPSWWAEFCAKKPAVGVLRSRM